MSTPIIDTRILKPYLTKYEKSNIIGTRALCLSHGMKPLCNIGYEINPVKIAEIEFAKGLLDHYTIERKFQNGDTELWKVGEMKK